MQLLKPLLLLASLGIACQGGGESPPPSPGPGPIPQPPPPRAGALVLDSATGEVRAIALAGDAAGDAVVVWEQIGTAPGGSGFDTWASQYAAGQGWGGAERLDVDDVVHGLASAVAVGPGGDAVATWAQRDLDRYVLYANHRMRGGGWTGPTRVDAHSGGDVRRSVVALDADGRAIAVWEHELASVRHVWAAWYEPGTGWGAPVALQSLELPGYDPSVALAPDGSAAAATWLSGGVLWSSRFDPSAGWSGAVILPGTEGGKVDWASVAMDGGGNAMVAWATDGSVFASRRPAGSDWGAPQLVQTDCTWGTVPPQLVMNPRGDAVVVGTKWNGQPIPNGRYASWAARYQAGAGWAPTEPLEATPADSWNQSVALGEAGDILVAWARREVPGFYTALWLTRRTSSGWSAPEIVDPACAPGATPKVALDRSGNGLLVWQGRSLPQPDLWAIRVPR